MPRLKDVAAAAGVSVTTVAVVLGGKADSYGIARGTRARVLDAARRLEYRHNAHARALSTGRSNLIGIVGMSFASPVRLEMVNLTARAALKHGYQVSIQDFTWHAERPAGLVAELQSQHVEAVVVAALANREERACLARLAKSGVPIVAFDSMGIEGADVVTTDRAEGVYQATRHLLALGHRRISLTVAPDSAHTNLRPRLEGYRRALVEAGVPVDESLLVGPDDSNNGLTSGAALAPRLLTLPDPPTAVLFQNDHMALAAMGRLFELGKRVPADLAVVGFDGIPESEFIYVPLTTIAQPVETLAESAVSLLVERLRDGAAAGPPRRVLVPPRLVVRRSCGAPRTT